MKRRGCLSESQLLDEQNSPSVCSEVAFMVTSIPKKPQHLSMLGAECVGGVGLVFIDILLPAAFSQPLPFPPA